MLISSALIMLCVSKPWGPTGHNVENYVYAVQAGCIALTCYLDNPLVEQCFGAGV